LRCIPAFALQIFVSNEKDNTITVIDGDSLEIKNTIKVSRRPRGIVLSPDNKELFVAAGDGDIMDVIDTSTMQVTRQLESGPDPELMAVDPKARRYIATRMIPSSRSWTSRPARCCRGAGRRRAGRHE
jgi:YVTN family beta-propeller protein